jgi:hypothetical protein
MILKKWFTNIFDKKIRNNYSIHNMIIIIIVRILANVRRKVSKCQK